MLQLVDKASLNTFCSSSLLEVRLTLSRWAAGRCNISSQSVISAHIVSHVGYEIIEPQPARFCLTYLQVLNAQLSRHDDALHIDIRALKLDGHQGLAVYLGVVDKELEQEAEEWVQMLMYKAYGAFFSLPLQCKQIISN